MDASLITDERDRPAAGATGVGDPARTEAWTALRAAHNALVDRVEHDLSEAGLPPLGWFEVLLPLAGAPDRALRPRELVLRVGVTKSGLTRLLDRIERDGLIERRACPSDRRGHLVVLTAAGAEMLERMRPVRDRVFRDHFGGLLDDEQAGVIERAMLAVRDSAAGGECAAAYEE